MLINVRISSFSPAPFPVRQCLSVALVVTSLAVAGCHAGSVAASDAGPVKVAPASDAARQQMELIPPPSKTRYMAIHSLSNWENPYLTAQGDMVTLHVLLADANTSGLGEGTLLRPVGARRQDLNVRVSDLSAALSAIPQTAWPYGRVMAVEEANNIPVSARPKVRRTMESAMGVLIVLGVVVFVWLGGGGGLR
jgi:hypothetical protein